MIVIYGAETCTWCVKAKALAEQYSMKYEYKDVMKNSDDMDDLKKRLPNAKTIPQIWWNGSHVGGYEDFALAIEETLGNYGQGEF